MSVTVTVTLIAIYNFYQVCAKQDFLSVFRSYLASLQDGSIVVFDSLDSTAKPPLNVSVLDIFQSIMYEVSEVG